MDEHTRSMALSAVLSMAIAATLSTAASSAPASTARAQSVLFVGNSFTYGQGSPVRFYRAATVTDLNGEGVGGVPALFKAFTVQAGLSYDVSLETHGGVGLDWHWEHARGAIAAHPWDVVALQSHSELDPSKPGDASLLLESAQHLSVLLRAQNPAVRLRFTATWPRADQVYPPQGAWHGRSLAAMTHDVRAGYERAAAAAAASSKSSSLVVGVGDAWLRAMEAGIADDDPYDGIGAGKLDLWTYDHDHASTAGYYLEALMLFGSITGRDPRSLGFAECSAFELGLSMAQVAALERTAADQLIADGAALDPWLGGETSSTPARCAEPP